MNNQQAIPLREQAMKALRESTTMFAVARDLLRQGNLEEAQRLRRDARVKRDASVLLMTKANALENTSQGQIRSRYHALNNPAKAERRQIPGPNWGRNERPPRKPAKTGICQISHRNSLTD